MLRLVHFRCNYELAHNQSASGPNLGPLGEGEGFCAGSGQWSEPHSFTGGAAGAGPRCRSATSTGGRCGACSADGVIVITAGKPAHGKRVMLKHLESVLGLGAAEHGLVFIMPGCEPAEGEEDVS